MQPTAARKLTYDDFLGFPDDGRRHELIDGAHVVTPSPATVHQRVVRNLLLALGDHLAAGGQGEVFVAPLDVVLSPHDIVEPDLLVVLAEQSAIVTDQHVRGAPAIVVEVLSPGTRRRDETAKRDLYARAGVREYWMVDPDRRAILVCRWPADGAEEATVDLPGASDAVLKTLLLPGFSLAVERLFDGGGVSGGVRS